VTEDLLLGIAGIAIGAGLLLGHRYILRQWLDARRQRLERPLYRAIQDAAERWSPSWMHGEGYFRFVWTVWLLAVGAAFVFYGVKLVLRAV